MNLRLKVVKGKPRGHCLSFPNGEYMFGRGPECDVRPNSDLVSRQHCLLHITEDGVTIRDLGSVNGTLVNGRLVTAARPLSHGDTIQIGPLILEVILECDSTVVGAAYQDTVQAKIGDTQEMATPQELPAAAEVHADS